MDELTAKKIENAKMVLEGGHCSAINCEYCFGDLLTRKGCRAERYDEEPPIRTAGGLDERGRKFFEDKLREYEKVKTVPELPVSDDICCRICENVSLKTDVITERVKTVSKRIITFHICPSCGAIIKAEVEK